MNFAEVSKESLNKLVKSNKFRSWILEEVIPNMDLASKMKYKTYNNDITLYGDSSRPVHHRVMVSYRMLKELYEILKGDKKQVVSKKEKIEDKLEDKNTTTTVENRNGTEINRTIETDTLTGEETITESYRAPYKNETTTTTITIDNTIYDGQNIENFTNDEFVDFLKDRGIKDVKTLKNLYEGVVKKGIKSSYDKRVISFWEYGYDGSFGPKPLEEGGGVVLGAVIGGMALLATGLAYGMKNTKRR